MREASIWTRSMGVGSISMQTADNHVFMIMEDPVRNNFYPPSLLLVLAIKN